MRPALTEHSSLDGRARLYGRSRHRGQVQGHRQPSETRSRCAADLAKREPEILASWEQTQPLRADPGAAREDAPLWVLHDGPPYSNGHIHYGHILNKILKDIVVQVADDGGLAHAVRPGLGHATACRSSWRSSASSGKDSAATLSAGRVPRRRAATTR